MHAYKNATADTSAPRPISVPVIDCGSKAQLLGAFGDNFYFADQKPVELKIAIDGQAYTAHALLYILDSTRGKSMLVGGRLSLVGAAAFINDRSNTLEFSARLARDTQGELIGRGRLTYYLPADNCREALP